MRARACSSVSDLVSCDCGIRSSPSGLSLRLVPAGRIARSCVHPHRPRPILLRQAGRAQRFRPCGNQVLSGNLAPNNSFKPSPLRGLGAKPVLLGRAGLTQALGLANKRDRNVKMIIAAVMLVAIAGLWQYNRNISAQNEKAAIAARNHKPFRPVGSHLDRSPAAANSYAATQPSPSTSAAPQSIEPIHSPPPAVPHPTAAQYACDGRTHCSQMRSCEEAIYFIQHCPNTKMDGNNDGVPCEKQWCN